MTTTTKPTPQPTTVAGLLSQLGSEVGGSTATKQKDLYDLGTWTGAKVNPGDLPLLGSIIAAGEQPTADNVVKAFASADPVSLAQMQRALYLGGWYTGKYTPSYGVISPQDVSAFAHAVVTAGQSGQSVSDLLLNHAKVGMQSGIVAAQQQLATAKAKVLAPQAINVPAEGDLEAQAQQAFENVLGRKAKPKEAAAFAAAYQAMYTGIERGNIAAQAQAVGQVSGGLTAGQATGFDSQLDQVGQPPNLSPQVWHGINNGESPLPSPAAGFSDQMGELQSLGQSVAARMAARTPTASTSPTVIDQQTPEDATVAAADFARSTHPKGAARNDLEGAIGNFMNIITGMGGA